MFGLIQGVLLSPPPYTAPDRLVLVSPRRIDGRAYTQERGSRSGCSGGPRAGPSNRRPSIAGPFNFLVLPDGSQSLGGMVVTRNFFSTLGLRPLHSREFTDAEASRPKVPATGIMLGYELWQRQFKGDPSIVGTAIRISRYPAPLTVAGVMPPGIRFLPDPANASEPNYDVELPRCVDEQRGLRAWNLEQEFIEDRCPRRAIRSAVLDAELAEVRQDRLQI